MRLKILFVDDQQKVLDGIRRSLKPVQREWQIAYSTSGEEALNLMQNEPFDVLVADLRMPRMSGTTLLLEVKKRYPTVMRVAMSGLSDKSAIQNLSKSAHQYLCKPCDSKALIPFLNRCAYLGRLLQNAIMRKLLTQMDAIPMLPSLYAELIREIESPTSSLASVGKIISKDMAMTSKVLQLAHSAFFRRGAKVTSAAQAASLLGMDNIKALAISTHVFSNFEEKKLRTFSLEDLWNHSLTVAVFSKWISAAQGATGDTLDDAFIAGLLHDVGRLVLATHLPDEYAQTHRVAEQGEIELLQAERETLGVSHTETGGYLLGLWGLSDSVVDSLVFHHNPAQAGFTGFNCTIAVHVANALAYEFYAWQGDIAPPAIDSECLEALGMGERLEYWRKVCRECMKERWGYAV